VDYCTIVRICYRSHIVDDLLGVYWNGDYASQEEIAIVWLIYLTNLLISSSLSGIASGVSFIKMIAKGRKGTSHDLRWCQRDCYLYKESGQRVHHFGMVHSQKGLVKVSKGLFLF